VGLPPLVPSLRCDSSPVERCDGLAGLCLHALHAATNLRAVLCDRFWPVSMTRVRTFNCIVPTNRLLLPDGTDVDRSFSAGTAGINVQELGRTLAVTMLKMQRWLSTRQHGSKNRLPRGYARHSCANPTFIQATHSCMPAHNTRHTCAHFGRGKIGLLSLRYLISDLNFLRHDQLRLDQARLAYTPSRRLPGTCRQYSSTSAVPHSIGLTTERRY